MVSTMMTVIEVVSEDGQTPLPVIRGVFDFLSEQDPEVSVEVKSNLMVAFSSIHG